jgi:hypothetical protein
LVVVVLLILERYLAVVGARPPPPPPPPAAIKCAPPGVSGVSQYYETVPGSSCDHPSSGPGSGSGTGGSLPSGTSKQLSKSGAVGAAVKKLVVSSGTTGTKATGSGARSSSGGSGTSNVGTAINGSGRGPLSAVLHPILTGSSSGGLGVLLPILLGAALVLVLFVTLLRRRLHSTPPPQT